MKKLVALTLTLLFCVAGVSALAYERAAAPEQTHTTSTAKPAKQAGFNKQTYSTTDPSSGWVIVNKQHPLNPKTYVPASLVVPTIPLRGNITGDERQVSAVMAPALAEMAAAAKTAGLTLNLQSGYRSYNFQVNLYNGYVRSMGQAAADTQSARPGYSEHQTGLAADLGGTTTPSCNVEQCFATTPEGQWLAAHAYEYGFVIRYPSGKQTVTGYEYEPWHVRYIGKPAAAEMHRTGVQTLEEFLSITGGETYAQ